MKFFKKLVVFISALTLSIILVSCVPKSLTDGSEKMEDKGYDVEKMSSSIVSELFNGMDLDIETAMACANEKDEELLIAIWFEEKENAEDFAVVVKLMKKQLEKELDVSIEYKQKGKVVYFGTEKACKDFEK